MTDKKTRSYLAIITEHKAIDLLRSMHPGVSLDEQQLEHSLMADTKWEEGEDLAKALLELSPEYREPIINSFIMVENAIPEDLCQSALQRTNRIT